MICLYNNCKLFLGLEIIYNNLLTLNKTLTPPMPYKFTNCVLNSDITSIIGELTSLLPQLSTFINQFNEVITQGGVNVITDSAGNMSIDVPTNMTDNVANNISQRIGIIDRLIATRTEEISDLIQKGLSLENDLRGLNRNYTSQLSDKIAEFNRLKSLYKH